MQIIWWSHAAFSFCIGLFYFIIDKEQKPQLSWNEEVTHHYPLDL